MALQDLREPMECKDHRAHKVQQGITVLQELMEQQEARARQEPMGYKVQQACKGRRGLQVLSAQQVLTGCKVQQVHRDYKGLQVPQGRQAQPAPTGYREQRGHKVPQG